MAFTQRYNLKLTLKVKPSPDKKVGLPDCLTNKSWHVTLSELPKGDEQYFIYLYYTFHTEGSPSALST